MWRDGLLVAGKDLRIEARSRVALSQVVPFGVVALVLFAFALGTVDPLGGKVAHDLGDFPAHVELAAAGGFGGHVRFIAGGCSSGSYRLLRTRTEYTEEQSRQQAREAIGERQEQYREHYVEGGVEIDGEARRGRFDMREQPGDAWLKYLTADEANLRMTFGLSG